MKWILSEAKDYLLKIIKDYYANKCYTKFEGVDKLFKLLTIKDKNELREIIKKEELLREYYNKMDCLSKDKEYCKMVWDERIDEKLRNIDAYNGGRADGRDESILQNKTEMILNMNKDGLPIEIFLSIPV